MTVRTPPTFLQAGAHTAENTRLALQAFWGSALGSFAGGVAAFDPAHGVARVGSLQLQVTQNGTPNMSVNVAAGHAWIRGTESATQGVYHFFNAAIVNLSIGAADATNARRDLIVAQVRDSGYSGSDDDARLFVVAGTPSGSPADPAVPANCLVLARVSVAAGATSIVTANITDLRTYVRPWNTAWGVVATGTDTSNRTNRTSSADINANVAVTFTSPGGRRYKISGRVAALQNTSDANVELIVYKNSSFFAVIEWTRISAGITNTMSGCVLDAPSSGAVTYSLRLSRSTGTVDARGDRAATEIIVEDVGPV